MHAIGIMNSNFFLTFSFDTNKKKDGDDQHLR